MNSRNKIKPTGASLNEFIEKVKCRMDLYFHEMNKVIWRDREDLYKGSKVVNLELIKKRRDIITDLIKREIILVKLPIRDKHFFQFEKNAIRRFKYQLMFKKISSCNGKKICEAIKPSDIQWGVFSLIENLMILFKIAYVGDIKRTIEKLSIVQLMYDASKQVVQPAQESKEAFDDVDNYVNYLLTNYDASNRGE